MKKPTAEQFREAMLKCGGSITDVAKTFGTDRSTCYGWIRTDPAFKSARDDERGALLDRCLVSARVLALGVPERDENGKVVGWKHYPDGNMLRYLISILGRKEGLGADEEDVDSVPTNIKKGVSINSWINANVEYVEAEEVKDEKPKISKLTGMPIKKRKKHDTDAGRI